MSTTGKAWAQICQHTVALETLSERADVQRMQAEALASELGDHHTAIATLVHDVNELRNAVASINEMNRVTTESLRDIAAALGMELTTRTVQ